MLVDLLERLAIPVVSIVFGAGGVGAILVSRRQSSPVTPPPQPVVPATAPNPATDQVGATLWIMAELTEMRANLQALQADHDRVLEEVPPFVLAVEAGQPRRLLSERVRTILGLELT